MQVFITYGIPVRTSLCICSYHTRVRAITDSTAKSMRAISYCCLCVGMDGWMDGCGVSQIVMTDVLYDRQNHIIMWIPILVASVLLTMVIRCTLSLLASSSSFIAWKGGDDHPDRRNVPSVIRWKSPHPTASSARHGDGCRTIVKGVTNPNNFLHRLHDDNNNNNNNKKEWFSIAPMMGHTHRHYQQFWRSISPCSYLYTEMIPAQQIVQAYEQAIQQTKRLRMDHHHDSKSLMYHPERILALVDDIQFNSFPTMGTMLDDLLRHNNHNKNQQGISQGCIGLQLGGKDPTILANAAAIGVAYGYHTINLNCGCPSLAVASSRQYGAALMLEPDLVARCVEAMSYSVHEMNAILRNNHEDTTISVKHRLGVHDRSTYDVQYDMEQTDEQAYKTCRKFMQQITLGGHVSKIHLHSRLALISPEVVGDDTIPIVTIQTTMPTSTSTSTDKPQEQHQSLIKINHKRLQYQNRKQARHDTIQNRNVPPLRPNIIYELSRDFPHIHMVSNGGITTLEQTMDRIHGPQSQTDQCNERKEYEPQPSNRVGAMIGRAVINHPCSFASVDETLFGHSAPSPQKTRQEILEEYIDYCQHEEERLLELHKRTMNSQSHYNNMIGDEDTNNPNRLALETTRRKLVSVPFHLFVGEDGNTSYQRRIERLLVRIQKNPGSMTSYQILLAALAEVPAETRSKSITDHVPQHQIPTYEMATKRSGPLQRRIH